MSLGGWDVLLRLAVAAALGAGIGFERELHDREAGTRTHLLVSLGAALFTVVGAYGFRGGSNGSSGDPTRVAAQIVTGIGFLGAGAILRQGLSVRGLTTAGSLWMVAAIGMGSGAGAYWAAVAATALTLLALWPLRVLEYRLAEKIGIGKAHRLTVEIGREGAVEPLLGELGKLRGLEIADEGDRRVVTVEIVGEVNPSLVARVADLDYVKAVRQLR